MLDRRVVYSQEPESLVVVDPHRKRILFKQNAERFLTVFEIGYIDAHSNSNAARSERFLHSDPTTIGPAHDIIEIQRVVTTEPLFEPFFFSSDGLRNNSPFGGLAQRIFISHPHLDLARRPRFDIAFIPHDETVLSVEKDEAGWDSLEGVPQPRVSDLSFRKFSSKQGRQGHDREDQSSHQSPCEERFLPPRRINI